MITTLLRFIYSRLQSLQGYKHIGKNSGIDPRGSRIWNKQCISIGDNSTIGRDSLVGVITECNGTNYDPQLVIGNNVTIGNGFFIACTDQIIIEDNVLFSNRVFIADTIHDYTNIDIPVRNQDLKQRGKVLVKEGAFIGINSVIHPGVTIGKNSVVGASSIVIKDVPDYCVVTGNPAKIIKRYDLDKKEWLSMKYKEI